MQKNKTNIIIMIIILSVLAIVLLIFMIYGILNQNMFSFLEKTSLLYENTYSGIEQIDVEVTNYDVELKASDTEEEKIEITGNIKNKDNIDIQMQAEKLIFTQKGSSICLGICLYQEKIIIYLPEDLITYKHTATSGSLYSMVSLRDSNIATTSGDINIGKGLNLELASTSDNIEITNLTNYLDITTTSGDITVK